MGVLTDTIEDAQTTANDEGRDAPAGSSASPFAMEYDTEEYDIDAETLNQLLTGVVALTNLI